MWINNLDRNAPSKEQIMLAVSAIKTYYKTSIIKTMQYWFLNGQAYGIERPEIGPNIWKILAYDLSGISNH